MKEFNLADFKSEINQNNKVAVFFYADWAAPSRQMNERAEKAFENAEGSYAEKRKADPVKYSGGFSCGMMAADDNKELMFILGVSAVPTCCLIERGSVKELIEGFIPEKELTAKLMEFIG